MKLFIVNKTFMDENTCGYGKEAHQSAYKNLRQSLLEDESVPLELMSSSESGCRNYFFNLVKADTQKEIYQYEYSLMVSGG